MNKIGLIATMAEKTGYTKKDITTVVDTLCEVIKETVCTGEDVNISGFGKFSVTERAAREGRNPTTGAVMTIAASKNPKFKAASAFKSMINS